MARPRSTPSFSNLAPPQLVSWAETLGEALGRGVARGINSGLSNVRAGVSAPSGAPRRGRPPKALSGGPVPSEQQCKVEGCGRPARSKGLCSAHYQAERRKLLQKAGKA